MSRLNLANPIVYPDLTMHEEFARFMNLLDRNLPIYGDGSPEGVVSAPQYSVYIDRLGASGSIEYRKMQTDIGGDPSQGWVLV